MASDKTQREIDESIQQIEGAERTGDEVEITDPAEPVLTHTEPQRTFRQKLWQFIKSGPGKVLVLLLLIVAVIVAVPMTRYAALGFVLKKPVTITVVDDTTGKPVSDATVHFARADAKTDSKGVATITEMSVGDHPLSVEKKYYTSYDGSYTVPIMTSAATTVRLKATGRLATITVKNSVSDAPVEGATIAVGDTTAVTDAQGVASIAVALTTADQPGRVSLAGYNDAAFTVTTKDVAPSVAVNLVPAGKVYFLSNRNATYDVMSSNVDGSAAEVLLAGTGREAPYELRLQVAPSRATLAYLAKRDTAGSALYMIDAATKALAKVDDSANINPVGWADKVFYYTTFGNDAGVSGRGKIKQYDETTKKVTEIDATQIAYDQGAAVERGFSQIVLTGNRAYYVRCWSSAVYGAISISQKADMVTIADGKLVTLKTVDQAKAGYCSALVKKPNLLYFSVANTYNGADSQYFRYQVGKNVDVAQLSEADFISPVTYLTSPNAQQTFWTETRDGKPMSFVGNANGDNARQTGGGDAFSAYGWLNDEYLLYSKNNNEIYIMAATGQGGMHKVTDYYAGPQGMLY